MSTKGYFSASQFATVTSIGLLLANRLVEPTEMSPSHYGLLNETAWRLAGEMVQLEYEFGRIREVPSSELGVTMLRTRSNFSLVRRRKDPVEIRVTLSSAVLTAEFHRAGVRPELDGSRNWLVDEIEISQDIAAETMPGDPFRWEVINTVRTYNVCGNPLQTKIIFPAQIGKDFG